MVSLPVDLLLVGKLSWYLAWFVRLMCVEVIAGLILLGTDPGLVGVRYSLCIILVCLVTYLGINCPLLFSVLEGGVGRDSSRYSPGRAELYMLCRLNTRLGQLGRASGWKANYLIIRET